jgi:hypothetical protein
MPAKTFNDLQKRIDEWTLEILSDQDKMDAWVEKKKTLNKLDASGLLVEAERARIINEVNKKKRLDELFGVK